MRISAEVDGINVEGYYELHEELSRICKAPKPEDEAKIVALLPHIPWELRCDAIEALANFGASGRNAILEWLVMERHPIVIFYIRRELILKNDSSVQHFLNAACPPFRAKNLHALWLIGNFCRGKLSKRHFKEQTEMLVKDSPLDFPWLLDELEDDQHPCSV